jgi:N12 class adenine-specific DNA methylase
VWRIIQTGNTYLAHAVGAGKTAEQIISGMEQKRLGLIKKPMYVVPNHMLQQFAASSWSCTRQRKIMVADEKAFHTGQPAPVHGAGRIERSRRDHRHA